jgi:phytoene synthase
MTPDNYCQEKAAPRGSSRYYSLLFLPAEGRRALTALYAWQQEVTGIVAECHDPGVAHSKLQWWRDELAGLFADRPQHPISQALALHLDLLALPQAPWQALLDGVERELAGGGYADFTALSEHCLQIDGNVSLLVTPLLGYQDPRTPQFAQQVALALALLRILRDLTLDVRQGRFYLPVDELQRFGVGPADLSQAPTSGPLRELFKFQAARIRAYLQQALAHWPAADRYRQHSYLIQAELGLRLLAEIEADGFTLLERRVSLTPLRKFWIAWRTMQRERRHPPGAG